MNSASWPHIRAVGSVHRIIQISITTHLDYPWQGAHTRYEPETHLKMCPRLEDDNVIYAPLGSEGKGQYAGRASFSG